MRPAWQTLLSTSSFVADNPKGKKANLGLFPELRSITAQPLLLPKLGKQFRHYRCLGR